MNKIVGVQALDRRYELPAHAGSDAVHVDPVYSFAVTLLELADREYGTGLSFTLGRGNEVVVRAIEALAPLALGRDLDAIMGQFGRFWRRLADDSQLRWLGPQKGAIHLALASLSLALVDAWALRQGKPLWQILVDMPPEELIDWVDLTYLEDFLTRAEALELLRANRHTDGHGADVLARGYPAYNTSVGWLGYDLDTVVRNCLMQCAAGFEALKIKVGAARLEEDLERLDAVRASVGPGVHLMTDANQCWSVPQAIAAGRELARRDCYWLEEPTHPDDILGYQDITRRVAPLRLASGECVANAVQFKNLIRAGAIHFVQADVLRLGGIPEYLAVVLMARKAGLPVAPHGGGDVGQVHQHLVVWQTLALGMKPSYLEYVPHLREHFVTPAQVQRGRFQLPRVAGAGTRLANVRPAGECGPKSPDRVAYSPA
jgi:L-fuconate dehydratase